MTDIKKLRARLEQAAASDTIPMSSIIRNAGGIKEIQGLDPTNAISELQVNARKVQQQNKADAEPMAIDTQLISDWVDKNLGKE